jgi:hypothetical protein
MRRVAFVPGFDLHPTYPLQPLQYDRTILHVANMEFLLVAMLL